MPDRTAQGSAPSGDLAAVYAESRCDGIVEMMPISSFLHEITEWLQVTAVDESASTFGPIHELGSASWTASRVSSAADDTMAPVDTTVRTSESFAAAVATATEAGELDVFVALGADPVNPQGTPIQPILGIATDGVDVAFLGWCMAGMTDYMYEYTDDATAFVLGLVGQPGEQAEAAFLAELDRWAPATTVPPVPQMTQYLPGLSEPADVDAASLTPYTVTVVWTPIERDALDPRQFCVGSESKVGTCWTDASGQDVEGGAMKLDVTAWLAAGEPLVLYQGESVTRHPLAEMGRLTSDASLATGGLVVTLDADANSYGIASTDLCVSDIECGPPQVGASAPNDSVHPGVSTTTPS